METLVQQFRNIRQASGAAADHIINYAKQAVSGKGCFTLVLAGGKTPQQTYELLGEPPRAEEMPWQQSHFFWGDERWVPDTHPDSNFSMVHNALFTRVRIPARNIHRISTGHPDPETGARKYEKHLRNFFHSRALPKGNNIPGNQNFPSFDLVLLGMGTDGHTVSLFPGSRLLTEKTKWVAAIPEGIGTPPVPRITLTLPVLNRAANIIFLLAGNRKRKLLDTFLHKQHVQGSVYPAALIKPEARLIWMVAEND